MQLIFNNPKQPNQKRNLSSSYFLSSISFAAAILVGFYLDWGEVLLAPLLFLAIKYATVYETKVQLSESELEINKRYLFYQQKYRIPLHKVKSWKLLSKSKNQLVFSYELKNTKTKRIALSHHRESDQQLISQLKKSLLKNEFLKLQSEYISKDSQRK